MREIADKEANALLRRSGAFWQPEYFDRFIRDEQHWANAVRYIHDSPVKAGLRALMAPHYGVDPQTGRRALYVTRPDGQPFFIWNNPPHRRPILTRQGYAQESRPVMGTAWARGHSDEQRLELLTRYGKRCQGCGQASPTLVVHHPHRVSKRPYRKRDPGAVIQSAQEQHAKRLCPGCHWQHQHGRWNGVATA